MNRLIFVDGCPICTGRGILSKPELSQLQAQCSGCGWFFTPGGWRKVVYPDFEPIVSLEALQAFMMFPIHDKAKRRRGRRVP